MKIRDGIGGGDNGWFPESVVQRVGDGESTLFWHDRWCGAVALRDRFSRLFDLALNKSITECRLLLSDVSLQPFSYDVWQWLLDPFGGYSVRGVYDMLTTQENPQVLQNNDLIWHKQVPLKVSIFAWRLIRDRLPTKTNLVLRGVLDTEACQCVSGCAVRWRMLVTCSCCVRALGRCGL